MDRNREGVFQDQNGRSLRLAVVLAAWLPCIAFGAEAYIVKDINPGSQGSDLIFLTAVGDRIFFRASDGQSGEELWVSDGTPEGTTLVKDIKAGSEGSSLQTLTAVGDRLFFVIAEHRSLCKGVGLWVSDGTSEGTSRVLDLGDLGCNPKLPTVIIVQILPHLDKLFFTAQDSRSRIELWALPLETAPRFRRGDSNADGRSDLSDAITTLGFLFLGNPLQLACKDAADTNDDGDVDVSDAIWTLTFKFLGGVEIPSPGPDTCGVDPTADGLPLCSYDPTKC